MKNIKRLRLIEFEKNIKTMYVEKGEKGWSTSILKGIILMALLTFLLSSTIAYCKIDGVIHVGWRPLEGRLICLTVSDRFLMRQTRTSVV